MQLEIRNPEGIFNALQLGIQSYSPRDQFFLEAVRQMKSGEEWKGEEAKSVAKSQVQGSETVLPRPFINARPYFSRVGDFYSVLIRIEREGRATGYRETSDKSNVVIDKEKMKEFLGDGWEQFDDLGSGLFYFDGEPFVSSTDLRHTPLQDFSIGKDATIALRLTDLTSFQGDLTILERVANAYLNSVKGVSLPNRKVYVGL